MKKKGTWILRIGALLLALLTALSLITPVFAASKLYPSASGIVDPSADDRGNISEGSFEHGETRMSHKPIWVLREFIDQSSLGDPNTSNIARAIDTARKYGVALGYSDGTFRRNDLSTRGFTVTFINRFFHESGFDGTKIGDAYYGKITSSRGTSSSSEEITRAEGIRLAGIECAEASNLSLSDFSTKLGKWAKPHRTPNGTISDEIYPHEYMSNQYLNKTCRELGYFTSSDEDSIFNGQTVQAVNILMFAGVLQKSFRESAVT